METEKLPSPCFVMQNIRMFPFSSQKLLKGWETGYCSHIDDGSEVG